MNQPARGEVGVIQGKWFCLTPPPKKIHLPPKLVMMFLPIMPLHKKDTTSLSSPPFDNEMTPKNEKIHHFHQYNYSIPMPLLHLNPSSPKYPPQLLLPCIHSIVSGMMIRLKSRKMELKRNKCDVYGAIILSVVGIPLG